VIEASAETLQSAQSLRTPRSVFVFLAKNPTRDRERTTIAIGLALVRQSDSKISTKNHSSESPSNVEQINKKVNHRTKAVLRRTPSANRESRFTNSVKHLPAVGALKTCSDVD